MERGRMTKEEAKKAINELANYCLNPKTLIWTPCGLADDQVYIDNKYKVSCINVGEWGNYINFWEQSTGISHIFEGIPYKILKIGNTFYIIQPDCISKIDNPMDGKPMLENKLPELSSSWAHPTPEELYVVKEYRDMKAKYGIVVPKSEKNVDPWTYIMTGFAIGKRIYVIVHEPEFTYLASFQHGVLHKELELETNVTRMENLMLQNNCLSDEAVIIYRTRETNEVSLLQLKKTRFTSLSSR